jgi:uncharacterized iron-regulated membrane protein
MAWLHTWAGLLTGWVLFFVFLTGTFGYVNTEVDRWMKPESPLASAPRSASSLVVAAEQWLTREVADAQSWYIFLPGGRGDTALSVGWRAQPDGNQESGKFTRKILDPATGQVVKDSVRETGGGITLYVMHYALHCMPYDWAIRIVGICTMFMLVAILSGVVTHKKIFKDFFTFRSAKGQRSWLDGHNLLSVTALPFHLMITWSGLIFFLFTYMPVAVDTLYPEGEARDAFYAEAYGQESQPDHAARPHAPLTPLAPLLVQAEREWGAGKIARISIDHPGRDDARVAFYPQRPNDLSRHGEVLRFDGISGMRLPGERHNAPSRFRLAMLALHEGRFAGPILRLLYIVAGLASTAMIATGLLLWSAKRRAKLAQDGRPHFGMVAVDVLNLGTIIGLPIGIAVYFWANRVIPVGMEGRGAWEVHAMFIAWGLTFLHAIWRPQTRAWIELTSLAAAAWGLLPLLNALTTDRHLGVTVPASDWTLAGIDLGMLAAGLFFTFLVLTIRRKQSKDGNAPARRAVVTLMPEPAE